MSRARSAGIECIIAWGAAMVLMACPVRATERYVPSQYATIQAAIDACSDFDIVIIAPGTYTGTGNRDIVFGGRRITLRSTDPNDPNVVAATIIKCNPDDANDPDFGEHRGFYFQNDIPYVAGLTIRNGYTNRYGAAIRCYYAAPRIEHCRIISNLSSSGPSGGVYIDRGSSPIISHCTISGNSGGGVYINDCSPVINHCTITGNEASSGGGIRVWSGCLTITDCTISGNAASNGGGIQCSYATVTVERCLFEGNSASDGGAVHNWYSDANFVDCTLTGNSAEEGGGMHNLSTNGAIVRCTFSSNRAEGTGSAWGGGMYNSFGSNPALSQCTFVGNTATDGGAIFNSYGCSPLLSMCTFEGNAASVNGGAIYNYDPNTVPTSGNNPTVDQCSFAGNSAGQYGGAVYSKGIGTPTFTRCSMVRNGSSYFGGALYCWTNSPTIVSCNFSGNLTGWGGGAIWMYDSSPIVNNCIFSGNVAAGDWGSQGGAIAAENSSPSISHCTIQGNHATYGGGGFLFSGGNPLLAHCILARNCAPLGSEIFLEARSAPPVAVLLTVVHSCVERGQDGVYLYDQQNDRLIWGPGNVDVYPGLTPDGHLRAGSLCIDAGDPNYVVDPNMPSDVDGDDRVLNGRVDIGADEYLDTDADGLPDWWEAKYFGSSTSADPNADADGDGLTNLQEYEQYGTHPNAPPYSVDTVYGNDTYDGLSPDPNGPHGPQKTIQAALDAAQDGDTIIVLPGVYTGTGNHDLDYARKAVTVRSQAGAASTTIDCEGYTGNGRAIDYGTLGGAFAVLEGFRITGGSADLGAGLRFLQNRFLVKGCELVGNTASVEAGGVHAYLSALSVNGLTIGSNSVSDPNDPNLADGGVIAQSAVNLEGDLTLTHGTLDIRSSRLEGPGRLHLDPNTTLRVTTDPNLGSSWGPAVIRSNVDGPGDIEIALGQELIVEANAVLDLSEGGVCNPDPNDPTGGRITVLGTLVVRGNAAIQNTNVSVKLAEFDTPRDIFNNNIRLQEASAGYGGEFFVSGNARIHCNTIVSEGDRFLDLDPDPDAPNRPTITNNMVHVLIKEGVQGSQGTLLELRGRDYDAGGPNNPTGGSGAYCVPPSSPGFTADPSANWVLEKLEVLDNAKLNLTNRPGFVFQTDANYPETVYVKELMLHPNAVLNTALQTLYYQRLVDENGVDLVRDANHPYAPLTNGSRIVDVPLLGFSLVEIAMEDDTEFAVRVHRRFLDNPSLDPNDPNTPMGLIERNPSLGAMEMRTRAEGHLFGLQSVAAKGSFARAGEDKIAVIFDYLFLGNPSGDAELVISLSDSSGVDANCVEIARVYPPATGRRGSIGSGQFATFLGVFPRGTLNFKRGVYVQIDLRGTDARCLIDKWDPFVLCQMVCADYDRFSGVSASDYLLLLSESGQSAPLAKGCLDLDGDNYIDMGDVLVWDMFKQGVLSHCGSGYGGGSGGERVGAVAPFSMEQTGGGQVGSVLLIAGKPGGAGQQDDFLYALDSSGACAAPKQSPTCPEPTYCERGNGRLVLDSMGNLYQIHGLYGIIDRITGQAVVPPRGDLTDPEHPNLVVRVGISAPDEGIPLADAAFDPNDPNVVYVVPVMVVPPTGCPYKAAAKLHLLGAGNYELVTLYGMNPVEDPSVTISGSGCDLLFEPDVQRLRDIEVDAYGNLFVLSAHALNDNDWVLIYDQALGTSSERRISISGTLRAPTALTVSSFDVNRLYLAPAVNEPGSTTTQVCRFTINRSGQTATGLTVDSVISVSNMQRVIALAEDPSDGKLWAVGLVAPTFDEWYEFSEGDSIFTTPKLAIIPYGASSIEANTIVCEDLALPLSGAFVPVLGSDHTLSLKVAKANFGTVTLSPDHLADPNDDPNDPNSLRLYGEGTVVTLTAIPISGKGFSGWAVWGDPNMYPDGNYITIQDSNLVFHLTMDQDYLAEATFKCGSGVEQVLPLLTAVPGMFVFFVHRFRRMRSRASR